VADGDEPVCAGDGPVEGVGAPGEREPRVIQVLIRREENDVEVPGADGGDQRRDRQLPLRPEERVEVGVVEKQGPPQAQRGVREEGRGEQEPFGPTRQTGELLVGLWKKSRREAFRSGVVNAYRLDGTVT